MAVNGNFVVVDASVVMAWLAPDERVVERVNRLYEQSVAGEVSFAAPVLLLYEVWNGLRSLVLRGRIKIGQLPYALKNFESLRISLYDQDQEGGSILKLAAEKGLTAYDASYVALARKLGSKLESLDKKLQKLVLDE